MRALAKGSKLGPYEIVDLLGREDCHVYDADPNRREP